jgi:hypothetical protein
MVIVTPGMITIDAAICCPSDHVSFIVIGVGIVPVVVGVGDVPTGCVAVVVGCVNGEPECIAPGSSEEQPATSANGRTAVAPRRVRIERRMDSLRRIGRVVEATSSKFGPTEPLHEMPENSADPRSTRARSLGLW